MPKITNFSFCDHSAEGRSELVMIPRKLDQSKFSIVCSLVDFNPFEDHTGYFIITDPDGSEVIKTDNFSLPASEDNNDDAIDTTISGVTLGMDLLIQFYKSGLYKTELYFDDEKIGEFSIPVIKEGSED